MIKSATQRIEKIGLWLNGSYGCREIIEGNMDDQIRILTEYLLGAKTSVIFLRIGYEFDNPFFHYSEDTKAYILAYQKIADYIRRNIPSDSESKVQFVWHSWAAPRLNNISLDQFYPGDAYVDWVGISVFQQVFPWPSKWKEGTIDWGGQYGDMVEVLEFADDHKKASRITHLNILRAREKHCNLTTLFFFPQKPTMIAESTPFGGINLNNTDTKLYNKTDSWDRWFGQVLMLIEKFEISMWSYINCDWESQPMWKGVGFGDTRLSSNKEVMDKWAYYVQNDERFLTGNSLKHCTEKREIDFPLQLSNLSEENFPHPSTSTFFACFTVLIVALYSLGIATKRLPVQNRPTESGEKRSLL